MNKSSLRKTMDKRGRNYWDLVPELPGQINLSVTYPGQIRAFHLHKTYEDHIAVIRGHFMAVTFKNVDYQKAKLKVASQAPDLGEGYTVQPEIPTEISYLSEGDTIIFLPGIWHGYQNIGSEEGITVYYETGKSGKERFDVAELDKHVFRGWQ